MLEGGMFLTFLLLLRNDAWFVRAGKKYWVGKKLTVEVARKYYPPCSRKICYLDVGTRGSSF